MLRPNSDQDPHTPPHADGAAGGCALPGVQAEPYGLRRLWLAYAIVFVAIAVSAHVEALVGIAPYVAPLAFLYAPFVCDRRLSLADVGLRLPTLYGALSAAALSAAILAGFAVFTWTQWGPWAPPAQGWGTRLAQELWFAALPEEVFFRGWMLPLLARRVRGGLPLGGSLRITAANALTAAAFAVVHLAAVPNPARLVVFFPGLWFGWLYERTGSLWWPIALHAVSNVAMAAATA